VEAPGTIAGDQKAHPLVSIRLIPYPRR